jgi:hypothetical protein
MLVVGFLSAALLFGGMVLYSFGFAAFIFRSLPAELAGPTIRKAFPYFYLFVLGTSSVSALFIFPFDQIGGALLACIALTTIPTRQILMHAINRATDNADRSAFRKLHGLSVAITLSHIGISAWTLIRLLRT